MAACVRKAEEFDFQHCMTCFYKTRMRTDKICSERLLAEGETFVTVICDGTQVSCEVMEEGSRSASGSRVGSGSESGSGPGLKVRVRQGQA
jgi:hypothetical protein